MRLTSLLTLTLLTLPLAAQAADDPRASIDWNAWRALPVQDGGRQKPFDTLAWESLRMISNRSSMVDADTGRKLNPIAVYLTMLFEWQGWNAGQARPSDDMNTVSAYFLGHQPDRWDRSGLLLVDSYEVRNLLGIPPTEKYAAPLALRDAQIVDPRTGKLTAFLAWAQSNSQKKPKELLPVEQKGLELAERFWSYLNHRMGRQWELLPMPQSAQQHWLSAAQLVQTDWNDQLDPSGAFRKAKTQFQKMRAAFLANQPAEFNEAAAAFRATLETDGPRLGAYPDQSTIDLEVSYNRWVPFRFAWALSLLALLILFVGVSTPWRVLYPLSLAVFSASLVVMLVGFGMRMAISGRAPVTNMYESVACVGAGAALFGLIFEIIFRKRYILAAAATLTTVILILADNCPVVLDPSLRPLQPVLRSNFWLATHVITITLSYAAFALALGISNITLGFYLFGAGRSETVPLLSRFNYHALQLGVALLAPGIILGGVWAAYSWGRFWGWDPKETWALIALLGYLAVLHIRYLNWVSHLGLAAISVICFSLVVMAWYGVNFVLGVGLHSYGFGANDGQMYVAIVLAAQLLFVLAAVLRGVTAAKPPEKPVINATLVH